jgi:hypothetical protein
MVHRKRWVWVEICGQIFTPEDIDELGLAKELCQGVSVKGETLVCFDVLSDLLRGRTSLRDMPDSTLLLTYRQLRDYNRFWQEFSWFDNRRLEETLPKVKAILKSELSLRKVGEP